MPEATRSPTPREKSRAAKAKDAPPAHAEATGTCVPRERLYRRVDEHAQSAAVWLQGPPGAGKTTLLQGYCHARSLNALLLDASLPAAEIEARARQLAERVPAWSALVIDGVHRATNEQTLAALARCVQVCLGRVPVLLASETLPAPEFAPLVARGHLQLIGAQELAFSQAEAVSLAALKNVQPQTAAALCSKANGWAAGLALGLAYAAVQQGATLPDAVDSGLRALVLPLIQHHVEAVPLRALALLAVLPELPDAALSAHAEGAALRAALQLLESRGLFVERFAAEEGGDAWVLHTLLRTALQPQADTAPTHVQSLQGWSQALTQAGHTGLAARLHLAYGSAGDALKVLVAHAHTLHSPHQARTLIELNQQLASLGHEDAWLSCVAARLALLTSDLSMGALCERAFERAQAQGRHDLALTLCAQRLLSHTDDFNDSVDFEPWAARFEQLRSNASQPSDEAVVFWSLCAEVALGQLRLTPNTQAEQALQLRVRACQAPSADDWLWAARLCLSTLNIGQDWARVRSFIEYVQGMPLYAKAYASLRAPWLWITGYSHMLSLHYDMARTCWDEAITLAATNDMPSLVVLCEVAMARLALEQRDLAAGTARLQRAKAALDVCGPMARINVHHLMARYALFAEKFEDAREALLVATHLIEFHRIAAARWPLIGVDLIHTYLALGRFADAQQAITAHSAVFEAVHATAYRDCLSAITQALILEPTDSGASDQQLRHAFELAAHGKMGFMLRSVPSVAARLCARALERGIEPGFVRHVIEQRGLRAPADATPEWPWRVWLKLIGPFGVRMGDEWLPMSGKVAQKPLELIKLLACTRGQALSQDAAASNLWPEADDSMAARKNLEMTVSRARRIVGDDSIKVVEGRIALDSSIVGCDVRYLHDSCAAAEAAAMQQAPTQVLLRLGRRISESYEAELLQGDTDSAWLIAERQRLRNAYVRAAGAVARSLQQRDVQSTEAIDLLEVAITREPLVEEVYLHLIQAYAAQGRKAEALHTYRRCRQSLSVVLGLAPSVRMEQLKRDLML
jgi:DNA-binding SARP family transcriptional activator